MNWLKKNWLYFFVPLAIAGFIVNVETSGVYKPGLVWGLQFVFHLALGIFVIPLSIMNTPFARKRMKEDLEAFKNSIERNQNGVWKFKA